MRLNLTVVIVLLISTTASAQVREVLQKDQRLKGVAAVEIDLEDVDEKDSRCGLTTQGLHLEASKALLDSGLKVVRDADFVLFVTLTTIEPSTLCVTAVTATLDTYVEAVPTHSILVKPGEWGIKYEGFMQLLDSMILVSSAKSEHGERVRSSLRQLITDFATRIRLANQ